MEVENQIESVATCTMVSFMHESEGVKASGQGKCTINNSTEPRRTHKELSWLGLKPPDTLLAI